MLRISILNKKLKKKIEIENYNKIRILKNIKRL